MIETNCVLSPNIHGNQRKDEPRRSRSGGSAVRGRVQRLVPWLNADPLREHTAGVAGASGGDIDPGRLAATPATSDFETVGSSAPTRRLTPDDVDPEGGLHLLVRCRRLKCLHLASFTRSRLPSLSALVGMLVFVVLFSLACGCTSNDSELLVAEDAASNPAFGASGRNPSSRSGSEVRVDSMRHEVGAVLQGQVITHAFSFQNTLAETIKVIVKETDCGCTEMEVPATPIAPGAEWQAKVTLDTAPLKGSFSQGGTIQVRAANGNTNEYRIALQGESQPPLVFSVPTVELTPSTAPVLVSLETRLPVDWEQAEVMSSSKHVTATIIAGSGKTAQLEVRGSAPPGVPKVHTEVVLHIPMQVKGEEKNRSRQFVLPVYLKQEVDLAVFPQALRVPVESPEYSVTLVFMGRKVSRDMGIPQSTCEGYEVHPRLKKLEDAGSTRLARWEFRLRRVAADQIPASTNLTITFADNDPLVVPIHVFGHERRGMPMTAGTSP